ncbi:MAG: serine acetyltransferase [Alcanivoracaceae bacterium]|nr:serine acetyltransferase [Alcanivoracaceae bacterium]|tara:strand:- start:270 stop:776 length:507 start_codon:yes stop_codon:yes gene_type:complete
MKFSEFWCCLCEDLKANYMLKSRVVVLLFRIANYFALKGRGGQLLGLPFIAIYVVIVEWFLGIEVHVKTRIGKGFVIYHGVGLVINGHSVIGENVQVRQGCCIGNKMDRAGSVSGAPIIGNNVELGVNAVVLGEINVADGVVIGAGAVVIKNCDPDGVYVGVPAVRIK